MKNREKKLFYETLELMRKMAKGLPGFKDADWKDVDDYIFSSLPFTMGDLMEIYRGENTPVYGGSAIEGFAPAAPTFLELLPFCQASVPLRCVEKEVAMGKVVCVVANVPGEPILITEADYPKLVEYVNSPLALSLVNGNGYGMERLTLAVMQEDEKIPLYTVSQSDNL